jgi:WD40 repeat protein
MGESATAETLAAALARAGSSERARLALLPAVVAAVDAVAAAHARREVHGELGAACVVVGARGDAAVTGWRARPPSRDDVATVDGGGPMPSGTATVDGGGPLPSTAGIATSEAARGASAYVAPERVSGGDADARGDVYSLGAILYHVLAGRPPYVAAPGELALAIVRGPPPPLADLAPEAPRALVAIADRARARDASDRYAHAGALADALRGFVADAVAAVPPVHGAVAARRWLRRRRAPIAIATLAVAASITAAALAITGARADRDDARIAAAAATTASAASLEEAGRLALFAGRPDRAAALLGAAVAAAPDRASPELRFLLHSALGIMDSRISTLPPGPPIRELAFDRREGKLLVTRDGPDIEQWSVTGRLLAPFSAGSGAVTPTLPAYSADDSVVSALSGDRVLVWDSNAGHLVFDETIADLRMALVDNDARTLLTVDGDGSATQWNIATGEVLRTDHLAGDIVREDASTTGDRLVGRLDAGSLYVWDWQRAHAPSPSPRASWRRTGADSSDFHDGLAIACVDREVSVVDDAGAQHFMFDMPPGVASCALDISGDIALIADRGGVAAWWHEGADPRMSTLRVGGGPMLVDITTPGVVTAMSPFSPIVTGFAIPRGIALWSHATAAGTKPAIARDSGRVAIARDDGSIDVFHNDRGRVVSSHAIAGPARDARGERVIANLDGALVLWDARAGRPRATFDGPVARLDASGTRAVGLRGGAIVVVDATTGADVGRVALPPGGPVLDLDVDTSGRRIAVSRADGVAIVDAAGAGKLVATLPGVGGRGAVRLSGDGTRVVLIAADGAITIADVGGHAAPRAIASLAGAPAAIATTLDGTRLAAASAARTIALDVVTGAVRVDAGYGAVSLAFDRDGDELAIHDRERLRVWRISESREIARIATGFTSNGQAVALSPDGRLALTAAGAWSVADGRSLASWLFAGHHLLDPPSTLAVEPTYEVGVASCTDDELVVATEVDGITTLDIAGEPGSAADIARHVAAATRWRVVGDRLELGPPLPPASPR